jgi:hypothetical protein
MAQEIAVGTRSPGGKPRKLMVARESLRTLGDSTLAKVAGGTGYYGGGTTGWFCSFVSGWISGNITNWSAGTLSLWGCDTPYTCQTAAATCQTCVSVYPCNETITCTCPGYGCLDPVPNEPWY